MSDFKTSSAEVTPLRAPMSLVQVGNWDEIPMIEGVNCLDPHLLGLAAAHLDDLHSGAAAMVEIMLEEFETGHRAEHNTDLGIFGPLLDRIRSEHHIKPNVGAWSERPSGCDFKPVTADPKGTFVLHTLAAGD